MTETIIKKYDLEERTLKFSKAIIVFCKQLPFNMINQNFINQLIRSSTSIGANYIEANESLSKKDFIMRIKISRKEAKETIYWLDLILDNNPSFQKEIINLIQETTELKKILSKIIENSK